MGSRAFAPAGVPREKGTRNLTPGLSNPGALEPRGSRTGALSQSPGYAGCVRNSRLPGSILLDVDARNLCAFDAETRHQSLLVENEGVSIVF